MMKNKIKKEIRRQTSFEVRWIRFRVMSVLKGKKMDKKQVQEIYRETTPEEEQEYFEEVENELQCDLQTTQESIDYRNQAIKAQKKYMRDSHGDMDDEEFLQNMNNVNNDTFFIEHAA